MIYSRVFYAVAPLTVFCICTFGQQLVVNAATELESRDRRSLDVGWLLRNLLLKSATASDVKADITRNVAAAKQPPPPPTKRRPRPTTTQAPTTPLPPLTLHPFFNKYNLFGGSGNSWKFPPPQTTSTTTSSTTTTTTTTAAPPPPPPPTTSRPRPQPPAPPTPRFAYDYDYYYPFAYGRVLGQDDLAAHADPPLYDFDDAPAQRPVVPPGNRKRPAPLPPALAPPVLPSPPARRRPAAPPQPPQQQPARLLYQYVQPDDISFNDDADNNNNSNNGISNDDAAEQAPEPPQLPPKSGKQQQDENTDVDENGANAQPVAQIPAADVVTGVEEGSNDADGVEFGDVGGNVNDIPGSAGGAAVPRTPTDLPPRLPAPDRRPFAKTPPASSHPSQPYYEYDSLQPAAHRFGPFGTGVGHGVGTGVGIGGVSYDHIGHSLNDASAAKDAYQFRDAFSDFHTTYDGDQYQPNAFGSYQSHFY